MSVMNDEDVFELLIKYRLHLWYGRWPSGQKYVSVRRVWNSSGSYYEDDGEAYSDDPKDAIRTAIIRAVNAITKAKGE